VRHCNLEPQQL